MPSKISTLMQTTKVKTKAVIKTPHLKAPLVGKNRGSKPRGDMVTPPAASHMVGDKQPGVWSDVYPTAFPTCRAESEKSSESSDQDLEDFGTDCSSDGDTDDEAWGGPTECPLEAIQQHLMKEVREYARKTKSDSHCALCPFRRFQKPWRLREHIRRYHTGSNNWCASGRKQVRICVALHDSDKIASPGGVPDRPNYLRRSAAIIRVEFAIREYDGCAKNNVSKRNLVDADIRLTQYASGPEIRPTYDIRSRKVHLRRVGYGYYSECFYTNVARAAMLHECTIDRIQTHMISLCENELASLQPKFNHVWEAILIDIFFSKRMDLHFDNLLGKCLSNGEYTHLTVDSTVKPTLPLLGQAGHNRMKKKKLSQAVPYVEQLHAVHIVRGSRGSVLLVEPMFSENIEATAIVYMGKFSTTMRDSVRYLCADKTNIFLQAMMRQVFRNLRGCALDPMHLAFALEAASWGKKTDISTYVRKIIAKFSPARYGDAVRKGGFYEGEPIPSMTDDKKMRAKIFKKNTDRKSAIGKLDRIDSSVGFKNRQEYRDYIVSAAHAFPESVRKKTRSQRSVGELLCASCNAETIEWHINNERIRKEIDPSILEFMAVGTTGSEALNAELKHWFVGINHLHATTMRLKLRVFHISKLLAFCSAMYDRTAVQIRQSVLLARVLKNWEICTNWGQWCQEQNVYEVPAPHPAMAKRKRDAERLSMWKRTTNNMNKKAKRLRVTPYTQKRVGMRKRSLIDHTPTE